MEFFALGTFIIGTCYFISKGFNSKIIDKNATFMKIVNEGLYHFTSLESAKKILESGYIKPSSPFVSYGTKEKSYFFAGMPSYEEYAQNVNKNLSENYELTALKININYEELATFKQRTLGDQSLVYEGSYQLPKDRVEIVEVVLDVDKNKKIFLREKTEEEKINGFVPSEDLKTLYKGRMSNIKIELYKDVKDLKNLLKNGYRLIKETPELVKNNTRSL